MAIRPDDLTPTIAPHDCHPKKPRIMLPPLACDSHFHVFGPHSKFPFAANRPFTPIDAPKEELFALHEFLGFQRGVFVQSTCHGTDNSVLVDLLKAGNGRYRGSALLDPNVPDAEVEKLDDAGVRGVRLHYYGTGPHRPREEVLRIIEKVEPYGWHIQIHTGGHGVVDLYDFIVSIEAPVVIDHIGRIDIAEGLHGQTFRTLQRLMDRGNIWVKLSGIDRISKQGYPYADAIAFPRTLAAHAPERVVWGTDWPHPNHKAMPNDGDLVDMIAEIAPDAKTRQLMLVDNPTKLFGF
ncbi:MAG TPA: amidohydrolase family protein [Xanthobacteraceae bacterium]|nr:amidohydrolase family protein [Xanthobacteraceae bacterium]